MFHFHKWTKWTMIVKKFLLRDGKTGTDIPYVEYWQYRECEKCGFRVEKKIKDH